MEKLTFSTNWNNKLSNDYFTTLRLSGRLQVGQLIEVEDRGVGKGLYEVIDKRSLTISQLNDWICFLDTGYNTVETVKILKEMYRFVSDWDTRPIYWYLIGRKKHGKKSG